jgi:hypothetical protein
MVSKTFTNIIIAFNIIMALLIFLSSQVILIWLRRFIVQEVGFYIWAEGYSPPTYPPPAIAALAIPNFPLFIFILALIVDTYFLLKLRKTRE